MSLISLPIPRRILAGLLLAVVPLAAGCVTPGMVWLPDSSGFIYPSGKSLESISFYDVAKRQHRVLIENTGAATLYPALSPDGKRIAVARLTHVPDKQVTIEIAIYDREGKELDRSREIVWREAHSTTTAKEIVQTMLFWDPAGKKVVVCGLSGLEQEPQTGIYDPSTKEMRLVAGFLMLFGNTPIRPAGKGFLVVRNGGMQLRIAFVDWEGKGEKVELDLGVTDNDEKQTMLYFPSSFHSRWDADTAEVSHEKVRIRLDTKNLKGAVEDLPTTKTRKSTEFLQQRHVFAGGARVRALTAKDAEGKFEKSRLEIITPGAEKARVVMDQGKGIFGFSLSPDKKLLAIWCADDGSGTPRLYVVNNKGELVSEAAIGESK